MSASSAPSSSVASLDVRYRTIALLALPVCFANIISPIQTLVDTSVIGHFDSPYYLAAMGVASQIILLLLVSFNFLQYASSGLAAQATGKADSQALVAILQRGLVLALIIAGIIAILSPWLIRLGLDLFQLSPLAQLYATTYLQVRLLGLVFEMINYVFVGWFSGQGQTRYILYQQVVIATVNVLLTLFFTQVLDLGIWSVALGTVLGYLCGNLFCMYVVLTNYNLDHRLPIRRLLSQWRPMLALMRLNRDILIRSLLLTLSFAWLTRLASLIDETTLAANAILLQVLFISSMALDGIAVAAESLTGRSVGLNKLSIFWLVFWRTGVLSVVLATVLTCVWWLVIPIFITVMTDIAEVQRLAHEYAIYAIGLPMVAVSAFWLDGVFFGLTAGKYIRFAAIGGALLYFPCSYLLFKQFGNTGVWWSVYLLMGLRIGWLGGLMLTRRQQLLTGFK